MMPLLAAGDIWKQIVDLLMPDKIFAKLPEMCGKARDDFAFFVAFFFLVVGLIIRLRASRTDLGEMLPHIVKAFVLVALASQVMTFINLIDMGATEISKLTGYDTDKVIKKLEEIIETVSGNRQQEAHSVKSATQKGDGNAFDWLNVQKHMEKAAQDMAIALEVFFKMLLNGLAVLVVRLAEIVILSVNLLRYFAVHVGSIFLPIFIALFMVPALSGHATRFVSGIIGVILWPVGWSMVNLGTFSLLEAVHNALRPFSGGAAHVGLAIYIGGIVGVILLGFVLIAAYSAAPMAISKMVEGGSNAALSIGGAAQGAAVSGAAAVGGAAIGTAANVAGGAATMLGGRALAGAAGRMVPGFIKQGAGQIASGVGQAAGQVGGLASQAFSAAGETASRLGAEAGIGATMVYRSPAAARALNMRK